MSKETKAHSKQPKKRGRPVASTNERAGRIETVLSQRMSSDERLEFLSFVGGQFCQGCTTRDELQQAVCKQCPDNQKYLHAVKTIRVLDLISYLAQKGGLRFVPSENNVLKNSILAAYAEAMRGKQLQVVQTASNDVFVAAAAETVLESIKAKAKVAPRGEVHVAFAGGRTLRNIAFHLAQKFRTDPSCVPEMRTLVFHSLVAAFEDDDSWFDDPNSFITFFMEPEKLPFKVKLVKMQIPAIIERDLFKQLKDLPEFQRPFLEAKKISILVTSGSLWDDQFNTIQSQLKVFAQRTWPGTRRGDELIDALAEQNIVGDVLWHPLRADDWVDLDQLQYRIATAIDLDKVADLIERKDLTAILVLGSSGKSRREKSKLLKAVLRLPKHKQVFTHLVIDSPTARGLLAKPRRPK
jgi:hypothetical protein